MFRFDTKNLLNFRIGRTVPLNILSATPLCDGNSSIPDGERFLWSPRVRHEHPLPLTG